MQVEVGLKIVPFWPLGNTEIFMFLSRILDGSIRNVVLICLMTVYDNRETASILMPICKFGLFSCRPFSYWLSDFCFHVYCKHRAPRICSYREA